MTIRTLASAAVVTLVGAACLSCSDPVPPAAQGAFDAHFGSPNMPDPNAPCQQSVSPDITVGSVTDTMKSEVPDGNGVQVTCTVTASGSFSVTISQGEEQIVAAGTLVPNGTGTASVQITTAKLSNPWTSGGATCTTTTQTSDGMSFGVSGGQAWFGLTCPMMTETGASMPQTCAIQQPTRSGITYPGAIIAVDGCNQ
jgi:hypothetical protein